MMSIYLVDDGVYLYNPKTIDIINNKDFLVYKSTSTPCSCEMCSYPKYDRTAFKKDTERLLKEFVEIV